MSRKPKVAKEARRRAKERDVSYQAARRLLAPETSSFTEQMTALASGPTRVHSYACCGHTLVFRCPIQPGFAEFEDACCHRCGRVLGNVRCDWGSPELVREVKGDANAELSVALLSDGSRLERKATDPKKSKARRVVHTKIVAPTERSVLEEGVSSPEELFEQLSARWMTTNATPLELMSPFMIEHIFDERGGPADQVFEGLALELWAEHLRAPAIAKTFAVLDGLINAIEWRGASDAITAIAYVLLREQGIDAAACRGSVCRGQTAFAHSWIEVGDAIFDVAIGMAPSPTDSMEPVVAGWHIASKKKTKLKYGVPAAPRSQPEPAHIRYPKMKPFMDRFPGHPDGLWGVAVRLARAIGLPVVRAEDLRKHHARAAWESRPRNAVTKNTKQ